MNWSDLVVIAIILGFGIIGLMNGFLLSMFRIVSFFLSIFISVKFYPVMSKLLMKTALFDNIKASILKGLLMRQQAQGAGNNAGQAAADAVVSSLRLPGFMKESISDQFDNASKLIDMSGIMDAISSELARMVISVISLVLLYVLARIALLFLRFILQGIAKLPLFKQMDKLGGFAFGAVEGLLMVYIICTVLMLFNTAPQLEPAFEAIDSSIFAGFFYQRNFIADWMFGGGAV